MIYFIYNWKFVPFDPSTYFSLFYTPPLAATSLLFSVSMSQFLFFVFSHISTKTTYHNILRAKVDTRNELSC